MKTNRTQLTLQIICIVIMVVIAVSTYHVLPYTVATHWNINGVADGRGSKLWLYLWIPAITIALLIMMKFLPKIDPKKEKYELFMDTYQSIQTMLVFFFTYLFAVCIYANLYETPSMSFFMLLGLGILFILIGNAMWKLRQNYFVWLKTPWTLSNEHVWNTAHRFTGKLWVLWWIMMIIEAFVMKYLTWVVLGTIGILIIVPFIYSYIVYKKKSVQ